MRITDNGFVRVGVLTYIDGFPARLSALIIGCMLLSIYILDCLTTSAPVQHLYYAPIILAALRFGGRIGFAVSVLAILLYHSANPRLLAFQHDESDILQIAVFIAAPLVTARLASDSRRLGRLASTDDLTGLLNLRGFELRLQRLVSESSQHQTPLSMLVLDLDRLKHLNDNYGHLAGSDAVRAAGRLIAAAIPEHAAACRYGGDEFAIAIASSAPEAVALGDELRNLIRSAPWILAGHSLPAGTLSLSVGVASCAFADYRVNSQQGEFLFRSADQALYSAKNGGRDRTVCVLLS